MVRVFRCSSYGGIVPRAGSRVREGKSTNLDANNFQRRYGLGHARMAWYGMVRIVVVPLIDKNSDRKFQLQSSWEMFIVSYLL